jgi:phosphoribosylformylglycinamidine synthase
MVLEWNGETVADIPLGPLADEAPCYERPYAIPKPPEPLTGIPESTDIAGDLLKLMASPNLASRRWVWQQYDQQVGGDTVQRPGGDAAVVRVHGTKKALAITTDCTPRYCYADPVEGGKQAVAEAYRNLCAVGAKPLAITNCLNFGNPERPEIMGQFVGCVEGIAEACRALDFPVVSGNVSLYNETKNDDGTSTAILPTPAIGGVGLLEDWENSATIGLKTTKLDSTESSTDPDQAIQALWLIGDVGTHLGQSAWLREIQGRADGPPPSVDLKEERRNGEFVRELISRRVATAVHDISDGGLLVALAEMALVTGVGAGLDKYDWSTAALLFGEDQGRYIVACLQDPDDQHIPNLAEQYGVPVQWIGYTGGDAITIGDHPPGAPPSIAEISLADLRAAHESFFPKLMGSELTPEF